MNQVFENIAKPKTRQYLYRVCQATSALLAVYGLIEQSKLAAIGFVAAAVFGVADGNVDGSED